MLSDLGRNKISYLILSYYLKFNKTYLTCSIFLKQNMAELADIVVHSKNKLTLQHETKLFVLNIPYSIKVPSQGGVCGRPMSKQHTRLPGSCTAHRDCLAQI